MKSCLQTALAIIVGLFAVIGIIVVFVFVLLPKSIPPAKPTPLINTPASIAAIVPTVKVIATATMLPATSTPLPSPATALPPVVEPTVTAILAVVAIPTPTPPAIPLVAIETTVQSRPKIYLPAIEVVPTPTEQEAYRQSLKAWLLDAKKWADDVSTTIESVPPNTPEWIAAFDGLEQRIIVLASALNDMQPPPGYVNAHEMMLISMEACTDAMAHFRNGKFGFADLSVATCTAGFTLAPTKFP